METTEPRLGPPSTKGHVSATFLPDSWFIACRSEELGKAPLARILQGTPLALFRDVAGKPAALLDRCPHRNVPLSFGKVDRGMLRCGYHGWAFDGQGACRDIPGLCGTPEGKARRAPAYPAREQDGFVWVYSTPDVQPRVEPFKFPYLDDPRYTTVVRDFTMRSTMHAALENTLDVPHTAFLHGGLFRTAQKKNEIEVVVRRYGDRVEAEYLGEPRPTGLMARLLGPTGGTVVHFDRFYLPSIAQVEYRLGNHSQVLATSVMTPVGEFETRIYAVVTFRLPIPGRLVKRVVTPVAMRVFHQDAKVLSLQTDTIERFGGEQYVHTEIDVLGPQIWRLMKQASRGEAGGPEVHEHRVKMRV